MPFAQTFPLGGNGDILIDIIRRLEVLEGRARVIQNGSIVFTDSNNHVVMVLGQQADGTMGLRVFNTSGQEEVRLGELNASPLIYGLGVAPATGSAPGTLQQVGGALYAFASATQNTASTTWTSFGDDPSVTAVIGPSGNALVTIAARIATSADANSEGFVALRIDSGASPASTVQVKLSAGDALGVNATQSVPQLVTGLTAGTHTFSLLYETANVGGGHNVGFSERGVTVQPL